MLRMTALNVGMIDENCFKKEQDATIFELAAHVACWLQLDDCPAIVGLNELAPQIAHKLVEQLQHLNINIATH